MKSTDEQNGNMIKKISSGGDTLIGRNQSKAEEELITHFLPVCLANDIPNITPYDDAVAGRVRVTSYKKAFVDEPTNELELKKDINIENEIKTIEFQNAYVGLLINQYTCYNNNDKPIEVMNSKKEWINEDKNVIEAFKYDCENTNNEKNFVLSKVIEEWIAGKKLGITMKKFGMEIRKYATIQKCDNILSSGKTINGKVVQVWFGVRKIEEEQYEEE